MANAVLLTNGDPITAQFKEALSTLKVFPVNLRSQLSFQASRLRATTELEKNRKIEVHCPQCQIVLSTENDTLHVFLDTKRRKKSVERAQLLAQCLGCKIILRCGMLPQFHKIVEEFTDTSMIAEIKSNSFWKNSKAATPVNTPPVKHIGSSIKKRSGARKLERMVAMEKSSSLESPKTSLSAFLSSIQ